MLRPSLRAIPSLPAMPLWRLVAMNLDKEHPFFFSFARLGGVATSPFKVAALAALYGDGGPC